MTLTPGEKTTEFALAIIALAILAATALFAPPGSNLETECVKMMGWVVGGYCVGRGLAKVGGKR